MTSAKFACATILALLVYQYSAQAQTIRDHRKVLGGVNLMYYCATTYGNASKAVNAAGVWRCRIDRQRGILISADDACRVQYKNAKVLAETRADGSWVCINPRPR